jgi:hypothetical protein
MYQKQINLTYLREFFGAMLMYMLLLVAANKLGRPMAEGIARTLALASPMIGVLLVIWAIARHFRRVDEFIRMVTLENMVIAAAVTAGLTFTYGFLENAGYPRLSMFIVMPLMFGVWGLVTCGRAAASR